VEAAAFAAEYPYKRVRDFKTMGPSSEKLV